MKNIKLSEYAKMEGVSVQTLRRRIKAGTLDAYQTETGRWYVNANEPSIKQRYNNTLECASILSSNKKNNLMMNFIYIITSFCNILFDKKTGQRKINQIIHILESN